MPTKHPRVSVTLTPSLQEAQEQLRQRGVNASVGELALAGARELLADADARDADHERRRELRQRLVARMRAGDTVDVDALREARETGWTRA
jgi:Arc/MetJ-type ribon-helix-helix transcriptional regulator